MSRSRRKNPFHGVTTSPSEKEDKQASSRMLRRKVRQALDENADEEVLHEKGIEVMNPWSMAKDGVAMFDPDKQPKLMRK